MAAKTRKAPWNKTNPRKTAGKSARRMSSGQKRAAKTRARKARRRYPNLVDNMWASSKKKRARSKKRA